MKKVEDMTADEIVKNKIHPIDPKDRIIATRKVCKSGIESINRLLEKWEEEDRQKQKKKFWEFWK